MHDCWFSISLRRDNEGNRAHLFNELRSLLGGETPDSSLVYGCGNLTTVGDCFPFYLGTAPSSSLQSAVISLTCPVISARLKEFFTALYNDTLLHYHDRQKSNQKYTYPFLPEREFQS